MIQGVSRTIAVIEIPKAVTRVLAQEEQNLLLRNIITKEHPRVGWKCCQKTKAVQEDIRSQGQKRKDQTLTMMIYPNHGYARKLIRSLPTSAILISRRGPAAAKVECWAMPTWCHIFNSTLTGSTRVWFDDIPPESVDSYNDLKEAFLENFLQQKKCIKDPVEIHHIKHKEGESTEDFMRRFKIESKDVKGAPEIMRISRFMHGITNPELIKRLHNKISKSVDEMMREAGHKQNFKKGGFKNQQRSERRQDRFTLLLKYPKEILALEKGEFKAPPPMMIPVKKRNNIKFCEFHIEVRYNTDECMHLKRQIEELLKNGKLSHVIKELKQNSGKDQQKTNKKGEPSNKDKALAILMVQPWQRAARQRITQSFPPIQKSHFRL
ncbi:reverse transcriptase domain-containing protein [Tanacetum coccineum]